MTPSDCKGGATSLTDGIPTASLPSWSLYLPCHWHSRLLWWSLCTTHDNVWGICLFFPSPDLQEHSSGPCVDSCEHPYQWYGSQKCTDNHTHKSHGRCHLHASCLWTQKKLLLILTLATLLHLLVLLCVCCCCTGVAGSVGSCWASAAAISLIRQPILVFMHGSCSTLEWERAQLGSQCQYVPTLSCWMWTSLPCLQEKAFSTVNFALHPPQCYCISRGARLKRRRVFSHHSAA